MKAKTVLRKIPLIMLFICVLVPMLIAQVPDVIDAKQMAKRYLKYGKIEVTEIQMEKQNIEEGDEFGTIKFTGTAIYKPAKIGKKPFKDLQGLLAIDLYDKNGIKVKKVEIGPDCGENKQAENVKYKKPFPFEGESSYIPLEQFNKIDSCKVKVWWILQ